MKAGSYIKGGVLVEGGHGIAPAWRQADLKLDDGKRFAAQKV